MSRVRIPLSPPIRDGHAFIQDFTNGGKDWEDFYESDTIKATVNIYFKALEKQLQKTSSKSPSRKSTKTDQTGTKKQKAKLFIDQEALKKKEAAEESKPKTTDDIDPR